MKRLVLLAAIASTFSLFSCGGGNSTVSATGQPDSTAISNQAAQEALDIEQAEIAALQAASAAAAAEAQNK